MAKRSIRFAAGVLGLALIAACAGRRSAGADGTARDGSATPTVLRKELQRFVQQAADQVELTSAQIVAHSHAPDVRRAALLWKMNVIPGLRTALERADDQAALLEVWVRSAQVQHFLSVGKGPQYLGDETAQALAVADYLVSWSQAHAERELGAERYRDAAKLVSGYVSEHPAGGVPQGSKDSSGDMGLILRDALDMPLDVVMRPLNAINPTTGLSDTAAAVERFSITVDQVNRDVGRLPEQLRWQVELLLLDMDENASTISALGDLTEVSASARQLTATARELPADLRKQAGELLSELDSRQGTLRETLVAVRAVLAEADTTLDSANALVVRSEQTALTLTELVRTSDATLQTLGTVMQQMQGPEPAPGAPPGKPFDIEDYTRTAEALHAALTSLNQSLTQVAELSQPQASERVAELLERTVSATAWRLFALGVGLLLVAGAVLLGVRRLGSR